ncbi:MAG: hypothetical protein JOZ15_03730 [Acidobacteria bacterium]|nr:hypothetical protein [Acidobacteriota bacterium]
MVTPGIQALFGFQLIVVFNQAFDEKLAPWQRQTHLAAVVLTVIAITLIMAPAALHRRAEQGEASERLLRIGTRLLLGAMFPLAIAICLDLFLVASVIFGDALAAGALAAILLVGLVAAWFVYPTVYRARRRS